MGGASSGRKRLEYTGEPKKEYDRRMLVKTLNRKKAKTANFKELFFKALDQYQIEYNTEQITNSNRLYQYMYELFDGISSIRFARLINEYKKERK